MYTTNTQRIEIKGAGWCFDINFFIQAALFERFGYSDWIILKSEGTRHNKTDGEVDYEVQATRTERYRANPHRKCPTDPLLVPDLEKMVTFRLNTNVYDYAGVFQDALKAIDNDSIVYRFAPDEYKTIYFYQSDIF